MSEDITIERALIEALLGSKVRGRADDNNYWRIIAQNTHYPEIAWSGPGYGRYAELGPWRMYTGSGIITGFDNILAKLRDPAFRERMNLPPLDNSE